MDEIYCNWRDGRIKQDRKETGNMGRQRILAVDDEEHILELIQYNLEMNQYDVLLAESGEKALEILKSNEVDLVLLDWMLEGMDGIEVLKQIRQTPSIAHIPVILLTAKSSEIDKVLGLEFGADDYLTKPFGIHELMARIKAVLRRNGQIKEESTNQIQIKNLVINKDTREVTKNGVQIELALKEFELLYLLATNRGKVFSRDQLLERIWGFDYFGESRTVDVHIRNLRKKIEEDDSNPTLIKTVRGVGYKFSNE